MITSFAADITRNDCKSEKIIDCASTEAGHILEAAKIRATNNNLPR